MVMKFFISSPVESLKEMRKTVKLSLNKMDFNNIFMSEGEGSRTESPYEVCMKEIEDSDVYILLLGSQYGWIPDGYSIAITEMEYDKARELKKNILAYKVKCLKYEPKQEIFISKVTDFFNGLFRAKEIETEEELQDLINRDIPQFLSREYLSAKKYTPIENLIENKTEDIFKIEFGEQSPLKEFTTTDKKCLLSFKARINYSHEAGSWYLFRIRVNGKLLEQHHLINKPVIKEMADGRITNWFNSNDNSWRICYSPNFKTNYFHPRYKVTNGDPYAYLFDLSDIEKIDGVKYEIIIEHRSIIGNDAFKNSIVVSDMKIT